MHLDNMLSLHVSLIQFCNSFWPDLQVCDAIHIMLAVSLDHKDAPGSLPWPAQWYF